jgi:Tol biopolymer transport system component
MLLAHIAQAGPFQLLSIAGDPSDTGTGQSLFLARFPYPLVSADGRWVAFTSGAVNLMTGQRDHNQNQDVFLHDRQTGSTVLVSHAAGSAATAALGGLSQPASISDDGRWLVYESDADDLVTGQTPSAWTQSFLYDRDTGTSTLLTHSAAGPAATPNGFALSPRISGDGNWITFESVATDLVSGLTDIPGTWDVFLQERATGQRLLVSRAAGTSLTAANHDSERPSISRDGRFVAFRSEASNLIPGFSSSTFPWDNNTWLFDRVTGGMTLVSHLSASATTGAGGMTPQISPDGSVVVFASLSANLVPGQTDTNGSWDLFLFDRAAGTNVLVSRADASPTTCDGTAGAPDDFQVAEDGAWVAFTGRDAQVTAQVRLFRRSDASVTLVSHAAGSPTQGANRHSARPRLSQDAAYVVFDSLAGDLVAGQDDPWTNHIYVFERSTGNVVLASGAGGSGQTLGNNISVYGNVSADGSLVTWYTYASDLVAGVADRNDIADVALYDRAAASSSFATLHAPGMASVTPAAGSMLLSASADGRYAVFISPARNVVPGQMDHNDLGYDVFLADRVAGTTTLVSHAAGLPTTTGDGMAASAAISADGAYVVFVSRGRDHVPGQIDTNVEDNGFGDEIPGADVFLYDRVAGTTTLVSHAAGSSVTAGDATCLEGLGISADGRYVAFGCMAGNLVAGQNDTNFTHDLFLYDRVAGTTVLVTRQAGTAVTAANSTSWGPFLSADGRWVGFISIATNLVAGQDDTNFRADVFLFDRDSGQTLLVSRAAGTAATAVGQESEEISVSPDGRYAVFSSTATNLVPGQNGPSSRNVFLFDRVTGTVELISRATGTATTTVSGADRPSVSDDGRYVAFRSTGANLVPGQAAAPGGARNNLFVHDRVTRQTELISRSILSPSRTSNGHAQRPALSPDGRYVAFFSQATDLAAGATGHDVYLADRQLHTLERVAEGTGDFVAVNDGAPYSVPRLSANAGVVTFNSGSIDLAAGDLNGQDDVYAWVRSAPAIGDFFTMTPCRLIDTRQAAQGPALASGVPALVRVHGACGIPATARAVALNVTVIQGQGDGRLTLHPGNLSTPATSTINFAAGQTLANNAILALASNGEGTLGITPFVIGGGTVHVLVDVSGYFQ